MAKIIILDTETTGLIKPIEAIEVAYQSILYVPRGGETKPVSWKMKDNSYLQRFKPSKPIEFGALSTSHILLSDLVNCEPSSSFKLLEDTEYLIGHNIDYDWEVIGRPEVKRICTKAMATYLIKDTDSYSQSALIYYILGDTAKPLLKEAHNAKDDIDNCFILFDYLLSLIEEDVSTIELLWEFSERCRIPTVMPFGKHKGELIKDIPYDYKQWLRRQPELDYYLLKAL